MSSETLSAPEMSTQAIRHNMKILLVQYRPAIRLYKWAYILQKIGHDVTVGYTTGLIPNLNWYQFNVIDMNDKIRLRDYDRYISFNPGIKDLSMPLANIRTIQAVGDIKNMNVNDPYEAAVLKNSDLCVFVSGAQRWWACDNLGVRPDKTDVIHNGIIDEFKGKRRPKINNGLINIVYSGTTSGKVENHRYILDKLIKISMVPGVMIHIYPSTLGIDKCYKDHGFVIHDTVSPYDLVSELSQYDAGLITVSDRAVGDVMLPNKYFEYLAADLPIISEQYKQIKFMTSNQPGFWVSDDWESEKFTNWLTSIKDDPPIMRWNAQSYEEQAQQINLIVTI